MEVLAGNLLEALGDNPPQFDMLQVLEGRRVIPSTIILDIDGCVFKQQDTEDGHGNLHSQLAYDPQILPGVIDKFVGWDRAGYRIILITGRPESCREETVNQLKSFGLFWQQLVMGVGGGKRYLINDEKPDGTQTAFACCPKRNEGLTNVCC